MMIVVQMLLHSWIHNIFVIFVVLKLWMMQWKLPYLNLRGILRTHWSLTRRRFVMASGSLKPMLGKVRVIDYQATKSMMN